jgi:hypothetical protein
MTIETTVPGPIATHGELAMSGIGDAAEVGLTMIRDRKPAVPGFAPRVTVDTSAH